MSLIQTQGMNISRGSTTVLRDVNFTISRGEIVTVVGPNGSGKSTFLKALLGVLHPQSGSIKRQASLKIGYVPQKLSLDGTLPLSVGRFLRLPSDHPQSEIDRVTQQVGATGLDQQQMASLSGGQFQRVLLARALLSEPDILVLDEPTQGLDQSGIALFYALIENVRRELGCAILLVSHDLHVVMSASDRVICINGHICCEGSPQVVSKAPEYRALFGEGTGGTLALYQHHHDHEHRHDHAHVDNNHPETEHEIAK